MPDTVTVAFYKRNDPASLIVRWDTRRPNQAFSEVPSHCAVVIGGVLYEMVSTGWHTRLAVPDDFACPVTVPVPDIAQAEWFARSCQGLRYDWWTIGVIALARLLPGRCFKGSRRRFKGICAWFADAVLTAGGASDPLWEQKQYLPLSPCDILFAVRETQ